MTRFIRSIALIVAVATIALSPCVTREASASPVRPNISLPGTTTAVLIYPAGNAAINQFAWGGNTVGWGSPGTGVTIEATLYFNGDEQDSRPLDCFPELYCTLPNERGPAPCYTTIKVVAVGSNGIMQSSDTKSVVTGC